jgi:acetyl-CoA synthetase
VFTFQSSALLPPADVSACRPLPGATKTKPGSATLPFFGIDPVLLDASTGEEIKGNEVEGVLCVRKPWPSIARTVYGDHKRFLDTYMNPYPGYYFTGDGAGRDHDGYIWIRGRVDDVINVSGHRLSTAEIESAMIQHNGVAETAVVGVPDELTGQAVIAYVTLKPDFKFDDADEAPLLKELVLQVRKTIGPFAAPKRIVLVSDLPKVSFRFRLPTFSFPSLTDHPMLFFAVQTRSGKIMRRILVSLFLLIRTSVEIPS